MLTRAEESQNYEKTPIPHLRYGNFFIDNPSNKWVIVLKSSVFQHKGVSLSAEKNHIINLYDIR